MLQRTSCHELEFSYVSWLPFLSYLWVGVGFRTWRLLRLYAH